MHDQQQLEDEHMQYYEWSGGTIDYVSARGPLHQQPRHVASGALTLLLSLLLMSACDKNVSGEKAEGGDYRAEQGMGTAGKPDADITPPPPVQEPSAQTTLPPPQAPQEGTTAGSEPHGEEMPKPQPEP